MSTVARRVLSAFLEPVPPGMPHTGAPAGSQVGAAPRGVAVLGRRDAVMPAAAAVALALEGCGPGLLVTVGGEPPSPRAPATPGAARLSARLRDRGHATSASGRLARLGCDPAEAARAVAVAGTPAVVAVVAPRDASVDRLLAAQDAVLVADGGDRTELVPLVLAGLEPLGIPCAVAPAPPDAASAALATAGIAVRRRWAAGLRAAMESPA